MKLITATQARLLALEHALSGVDTSIRTAAKYGAFQVYRNLSVDLSEDDVQALIKLIEASGYRVSGDETSDHTLLIEWS